MNELLFIAVVVVVLVIGASIYRRWGTRQDRHGKPRYGSQLKKNIEEMREDAPFGKQDTNQEGDGENRNNSG